MVKFADFFRRSKSLLEEAKRLILPSQVTDADAQISVKGLGHRYKTLVALENISINLRSGDFVCLLGPSGCGKTTLLYSIAGHIKPSGGVISLDGKPIEGPGPERLLMFQEPWLFPWLTVKQNLTFPLAAAGISRAERNARANKYVRLMQLEGFENALPHQLSGGMKMRVSLGRCLAMDSAVLLMDEPFGSLDAQTRFVMQELLQSIWMTARKTIVFVTHDVREALLLATRLVLMAARPGRVIRDFEIQLAMPRRPENKDLVSLERDIRTLMASPRP